MFRSFCQFLTLCVSFFFLSAAHAATITVTSAVDALTSATGCTLRGAVGAINSAANLNGCTGTALGYGDQDTIEFAAALDGQTIIVANGGQIEIAKTLIIDGLANTPGGIILNAAPSGGGVAAANRILYVSGSSALTVRGLTFQNGNAGLNSGGAIYAANANHTLTVEQCAFDNNQARYGGAIYAYSYATVSASTFTNNEATTNSGGAIFANDDAAVSASTFTDNSASNSGGAIYAVYDVTVSASTFTNNEATTNSGGAIYADENLWARHLTLANNTAGTLGASIYVRGYGSGYTLDISNSIIVGESNANAHCAVNNATITGGTNLEWTETSPGTLQTSCGTAASVSVPTSLTEIFVTTTPVANGGPTDTLALATNSPAIGVADKTPSGTSQMLDIDFTTTPPTATWTDATVDQRGSARKAVAAGRDIGAFETNSLVMSGNPAAGIVGDSYTDNSIAATGGASPYQYSVTRGSLPAGLILNPGTGEITGTPSQAGTYTFTVTATDSSGTPAFLTGAAFTITIQTRALPSGVSIPVLPMPLLIILAGLLTGLARMRMRRMACQR